MKKRFVFLLLALIFVLVCQKKDTKYPVLKELPYEIVEETDFKVPNAFPNYRNFFVNNEFLYLRGLVGPRAEEKIRVWKFSLDGKYIDFIDLHKGEGPGDFMIPKTIYLNGHYYILDDHPYHYKL